MSDQTPTPSKPADPRPAAATRRAVLRSVGLVALAGGGVAVLGGCTTDPEVAAPASSAPGTPAPTSSAPATPSPADRSTAKVSASAKPPSGPSVATSDVPVGGGVILKDADFVITQPTKGDFKAFSKICTHQGCPVATVSDGTITCKCHGSEFSIKDGSVTHPPASKPLAEAAVTVSGGRVVVTG